MTQIQVLTPMRRNQLGADRLVWGSDMPNVERFCTYKQSLDYVRRYCPFLTEREKRQLLKTLRQTDTREARRDRVIIELFLGTGIRLRELVGLDADDVDLDAKHIRIVGKGNVPQVKFLKTDLRSLLRGYLAERRRMGTGECAALFLSNRDTRLTARQVARRLDAWVKAAGIGKRLGPHALRHTFATHLYAKSGDILIVQRALGHANLSTTQVYTHLVDGALEDAMERL
ncbi:MAG TPA: tyrosine-type recombinase/integrase, partial [Candidatus Hydrogenedentes bacterium]|nr:tyrosine-type recombinase/integrase [Candidatus Hydrogenedentota bacterium]